MSGKRRADRASLSPSAGKSPGSTLPGTAAADDDAEPILGNVRGTDRTPGGSYRSDRVFAVIVTSTTVQVG